MTCNDIKMVSMFYNLYVYSISIFMICVEKKNREDCIDIYVPFGCVVE
jgi:hypothetical protein